MNCNNKLAYWNYKGTHLTSTLSNKEEVGYLWGNDYCAAFVIGHQQCFNEECVKDHLNYVYYKADRVKIRNGWKKFVSYCKKQGDKRC